MASAAAVGEPPSNSIALVFNMKTIKAFFQPKCKHTFNLICNHAFMSYGQRLNQAIDIAEKDRNYLAAVMKVSVQSIGQVITGKSKAHTAVNCAVASRALNVDFFWLATGEGVARPVEIPMRKERDALSVEGVKHAAAFDKLTESQKRTWRTLLMTVRTAVTDAHVEQTISAPPDDSRQKLAQNDGDQHPGKK